MHSVPGTACAHMQLQYHHLCSRGFLDLCRICVPTMASRLQHRVKRERCNSEWFMWDSWRMLDHMRAQSYNTFSAAGIACTGRLRRCMLSRCTVEPRQGGHWVVGKLEQTSEGLDPGTWCWSFSDCRQWCQWTKRVSECSLDTGLVISIVLCYVTMRMGTFANQTVIIMIPHCCG